MAKRYRNRKSFEFHFPRFKLRKLKHQVIAIVCIFLLISIVEEPRLAVIMVALYLIYLSMVYVYRFHKRNLILKSDIGAIDTMTGENFEIYLEHLFKQQGYKVHRTPLSGDFGADLILDDGGIKTAVQAKRYNNKIGLTAVQEVVGAKLHYGCNHSVVITNNYFTPQAEALAKSNEVYLWDRDHLIKQILEVKRAIEKSVEKEC